MDQWVEVLPELLEETRGKIWAVRFWQITPFFYFVRYRSWPPSGGPPVEVNWFRPIP